MEPLTPPQVRAIYDLLDSLLFFFTTLGTMMTIYSGVFASRAAFSGFPFRGMGDAVDHGIAYGFLTAWPLALVICYLRTRVAQA